MALVLYHVEDAAKEKQISALCRELHLTARRLTNADRDRAVAALCGEKVNANVQKAPAGYKLPEVLIFSGFAGEMLDVFLAAYKKAGIAPIPLKAVHTEHNNKWSLYALCEELRREHVAVRPGGADRFPRVMLIHPAVLGERRKPREPVAEPLHAAPFVVHRNQNAGFRLMNLAAERPELLRVLKIPREENHHANEGRRDSAAVVFRERRAAHIHHYGSQHSFIPILFSQSINESVVKSPCAPPDGAPRGRVPSGSQSLFSSERMRRVFSGRSPRRLAITPRKRLFAARAERGFEKSNFTTDFSVSDA